MDLLEQPARLNADPAMLEQVRALLVQQEQTKQQLAQQEARIVRQDQLIAEREFKIKALTLELAHHRRIRFGKASEAYSGHQLETVDADLAAMEAELEQLQSDQPAVKRKRAGRQPLPPELPRIEHGHEPVSCQCSACGRTLVKIGEDVSEQLDVEPARFFVHRHIRPQYASRGCDTVTAAPVPPAVIDGGPPGRAAAAAALPACR